MTDFKCDYCEDTGECEELCSHCSGSGEGSYDGSTCITCKGSGVAVIECIHCDKILEDWRY